MIATARASLTRVQKKRNRRYAIGRADSLARTGKGRSRRLKHLRGDGGGTPTPVASPVAVCLCRHAGLPSRRKLRGTCRRATQVLDPIRRTGLHGRTGELTGLQGSSQAAPYVLTTSSAYCLIYPNAHAHSARAQNPALAGFLRFFIGQAEAIVQGHTGLHGLQASAQAALYFMTPTSACC